MDLNYLVVRNDNEKMLKKLLHFLKKCWNFVVLNGIEKNIENQHLLNTIEKILKNIDIDWTINRKSFNYWTLLKDQ